MIRGVFTFPWRKEILVFHGEKKIEMKLYYNLYSEQKLKLKKDLRKHGMIFSFVKGFKEQGFKNNHGGRTNWSRIYQRSQLFHGGWIK